MVLKGAIEMNKTLTNSIKLIMYALILIGALNWGLVGLFGFDLVASALGKMSGLSRLVYTIIGFAAFYELLSLPVILRQWEMQLHHDPILA
jgi:uncharacterized membrane protein YuzA (DUF378 family)